MTDREKLVELLEKSFEEQHQKRGLLTAKHTADHLLANGVRVQQWISVKDDPPQLGERVLFSCGDFVGEAYLSQTGRWIRHGALDVEMMFGHEVTHPAPAKEE